MADLLSQVRRYLRRHDLLDQNQTVVAGVSGGPDSLCLLHLLHRLAPEMGLRLTVAHLNHGLRGEDAESDARFVASFAADLGLPCIVRSARVAELAEAASISLEEAARQIRYRFLAEVAADVGASAVAVGHNADDQAETVLMHFLRGSGVAGLRGMLPKALLGDYRLVADAKSGGAEGRRGTLSPGHPVTGSPCHLVTLSPRHPITPLPVLSLIRPLLSIPRAAIQEYCAEQGLRPRFDRSNEDTTFFRNRLRHELLPILAGYNPRIREVLAHTAEVLAGDHEVLREATAAAWQRVIAPHPHPRPLSLPGRGETTAPSPRQTASGDAASTPHQAVEGGVAPSPLRGEGWGEGRADAILFDLSAWRGLPLGLQRATLREAIHRLRASLRNINWEHVEAAVWLAREGSAGQAATLAAGLELCIGYRSLRIAAEGAAWRPDVPQVTGEVRLAAPGITGLDGGWRVTVVREAGASPSALAGAGADPWTAVLDAEAVGAELLLRPRQPGDRFQPQGMGGHSIKLNEFMINAQVPRDGRAGWPLLVGAGGIAWVCGLRIAERVIVRSATEDVWQVRIARDDT